MIARSWLICRENGRKKMACWQRLSCRCDPRIAGPLVGKSRERQRRRAPGRSVRTRSPRLGRRRRADAQCRMAGRVPEAAHQLGQSGAGLRGQHRPGVPQVVERCVRLFRLTKPRQPRARAEVSTGNGSNGLRELKKALELSESSAGPPAPARPLAAVSPTAVIEAPQAHVLAVPGANRTASPRRALCGP